MSPALTVAASADQRHDAEMAGAGLLGADVLDAHQPQARENAIGTPRYERMKHDAASLSSPRPCGRYPMISSTTRQPIAIA